MKKSILVILLFAFSPAFAQPDSSGVPRQHRFAPRVRTVSVEASTYWFYYKGFGGVFDLDLVDVPSATVQGVGIRLTYQEYRKGAVFSFDRRIEELSVGRSACFRGTMRMQDTRSDAIIGVSQGDPQLRTTDPQLIFGIDTRAIIVKPFAAVFGRIMGCPNGIWIQFGVAVGYFN